MLKKVVIIWLGLFGPLMIVMALGFLYTGRFVLLGEMEPIILAVTFVVTVISASISIGYVAEISD